MENKIRDLAKRNFIRNAPDEHFNWECAFEAGWDAAVKHCITDGSFLNPIASKSEVPEFTATSPDSFRPKVAIIMDEVVDLEEK